MSVLRKVLTSVLATTITGSCGLAVAESAVVASGAIASASVPQYDAPVTLDVKFNYYIDDNLAEQDVFIEHEPGSNQVFRVTAADRDMGQQIFAAATPLQHAPFEADKNGPWRKGKALDFTLGEWFAGHGEGSYSCQDGAGHIKVEFNDMLPNAVYTMWHFFMAMPPTEPFIGTYDIPVGARDGSQSVFQTDSSGNAVFERSFKPCLQLSGEHLAAGLAVAWHSDGKTYGPLPGDFATDSHVQLYMFLPKRSGI